MSTIYQYFVVVLIFFLNQANATCDTQLLYPQNYIDNGDFQSPNLGTLNFKTSTPCNVTGWTCVSSQLGKGSNYNPRWISPNQVIELGVSTNMQYNQTINLAVGVQYKIELMCSARANRALNTSGFCILWNDVLILDESIVLDYQIHTYSVNLITTQVSNKLTLQGMGVNDALGSVCDNVKVREVYYNVHFVEINGSCQCEPGYYTLPPNPECFPCSNADPQCLQCSNTTNASSVYVFECSSCNEGFYPSGATCTVCSSIHPNCLKCAAGAICAECDSAANWALQNSTCECPTGFFQTSGVCVICTTLDPSCSTCQEVSAIPQCLTCLTGLFPVNTTCVPCNTNLKGCTECDISGSICTYCNVANNWDLTNGSCSCPVGFYQNIGSTACLPCTDLDSQCTECSQIASVYSCLNCSTGFYPAGSVCLPCDTYLVGCTQCDISGSICTHCEDSGHWQLVPGKCECQSGYYLNSSANCLACSSVDPDCLLCHQVASAIECTKCSTGYFPAGASCLPCATNLVGCEKCDTTGTRCTECDHDGNWDLINGKCTCRSGYYSNVTLSICFPCANLDPSCTSCSETPVYECLACSTGFYPINTTCLPCSTDLVGCSECDTTGTRCTECDHDGNWVLRSGQCICRSGYYSNETSGVCIPCTNLDPLCTSCSQAASVYACLSCSHGYLPSNSSCLPCDSYLPGCSECDVTGTVCTECDHHGHWDLRNGKCSCQAGYYFNQTLGLCFQCANMDPLCTSCNQIMGIYECLSCSTGYFPINTSCQACSTNLVGCEKCSENGSTCQQCQDHDSNWELIDGQCLCKTGYYLAIDSCQVCTLEGCLRCSSNQTCDLCGEGYMSQPNKQFMCDRISGCSDLMNTSESTSSSSVPAVEYTLEECQNVEKYKTVADVVAYASYALLLWSVVNGKIIGLQLFGVLQLAYFNLADHDFVNLYLSPFLNWRFVNGFNFKPILNAMQTRRNLSAYKLGAQVVSGTHMATSSTNDVVSQKVKAIGYTHSFIENMNFMLLLMLVEYFLSLFVIALSCKCKNLRKFGYFLLKQVFLTIFIFNCFNITFSAGLHFKYATAENTEDYQLSSVAAVLAVAFCFIAIISLQLLNHDGYGEFKKKFKINCVTRAYITISILYRMALGFYMALGNEQQYQSLLILAISLAYLMFNIINLPFIDAYQNYRANLCHVTQLVILFVCNFYSSMKANEPLELKSRRFAPALLEIALVVLCLFVSAVCLFYELFKFMRKKCGGNKISNQSVSDKSREQIYHTQANDELCVETN